ncbi:ECF transporter S component [Massilibacteroides sp.]|uniref:ECF transporter S component n=1 Tax=Massilibacteroides sp. TaxID=2034766 RepID=UPI002631469D|nr:ECF transporter S component [Massilibacteroides sp.]MDD4515490.1 ECF transporter S component [Massilibacteroides sp.]
METTVKLYSLSYTQLKTYAFAGLFVAGNIVFPQLCHLVPNGGLILLPIYFFTLIAAYKYGLTVGLLTAVLSPLANHLLFGMPPAPVLLPILIKSSILAVAAALVAHRLGKVSFWGVRTAVLVCQFAGTILEWTIVKDFFVAIQDFSIGIPGIILQIFGGYAVLRTLTR